MKLSIVVALFSSLSLSSAFAESAVAPSSLVNQAATVQKFLARGNCSYRNTQDRGAANTFAIHPGSSTLMLGAADRNDGGFWDGSRSIVGAAIDANSQTHSEGFGAVVLMENGEGFYWYQDSSVSSILDGFTQGKTEVETFILERCDS